MLEVEVAERLVLRGAFLGRLARRLRRDVHFGLSFAPGSGHFESGLAAGLRHDAHQLAALDGDLDAELQRHFVRRGAPQPGPDTLCDGLQGRGEIAELP
nr:hypothetical protein [Streptomyces chryseus]